MTGKKSEASTVGNGKRGSRKPATGTAVASVPQILKQIDQLSESDRLLLEKTLAQRVEAEWLREAQRARRRAGQRGIDQAAIDRAVEDVRYRRRANGGRG